jgi:hypothetical protein
MSPPQSLQFAADADVTLPVALDLRLPEVLPGRWHLEEVAVVLVPEAPLDKDDGLSSGKNKVRLSGQPFVVDAIPQAEREQGFPDGDLRLRVLAFDASHHLATLLGRNDVCHQARLRMTSSTS